MKSIKVYYEGNTYVPEAVNLSSDGLVDDIKIRTEDGKDVWINHKNDFMSGTGIYDQDGTEIFENQVISLTEVFDDEFFIRRYAVVEYDTDEGAFKLCMYYYERYYSKIDEKFIWESSELTIENFDFWKDFHEGEGIKVVGHKKEFSKLINTFELIYRGN